MKKASFLIVFAFIFNASLFAQHRQHYFPVWTFHDRNATIDGVSMGLVTGINHEKKNVVTNGVRLELVGLGIFLPLVPESPVRDSEEWFAKVKADTLSETVNGMALSATGTICDDCLINGISVGFVGQLVKEVNGLSAAGLINIVYDQKGAQLAFMGTSNYRAYGMQLSFLVNSSLRTRGMQVALFNYSDDLRGIQLGLWNRNGRRALPLINWQFSKNKERKCKKTALS